MPYDTRFALDRSSASPAVSVVLIALWDKSTQVILMKTYHHIHTEALGSTGIRRSLTPWILAAPEVHPLAFHFSDTTRGLDIKPCLDMSYLLEESLTSK
ncbi:hypothetical protein F2P79_004647 [Pimephales promelas]|nr:hypothetical protein F2P79_004647 [Pimephales promelas]